MFIKKSLSSERAVKLLDLYTERLTLVNNREYYSNFYVIICWLECLFVYMLLAGKIQCMQLFINDKTLWCSIRFCFPFSFSTSNIMRWENIWSAPRSETNSRTSQHCVCIPKLADCTKSILFICHVVLRCHESNERHQIGMRKSIWNDWVWCRLVWTSGLRRRWPHH